ncbi:MAG: hypothetical protein ACLFM1_01500 [Bacteroidales bacterium]
MKQALIVLTLITTISFCTHNSFSQTKEELEAMQQDFEDFKNQERDNFRKFVEERDKDFAAYLKEEIKNIELMKGRKQIRVPGPEKIPRFTPEKQSVKEVLIPEMQFREYTQPGVSPGQTVAQKPENTRPEIRLPEITEIKPEARLKTAEFDFYGTKQRFHYDPEMHQNPGSTNKPEMISAYFETLSKTGYYPLLESLVETHDKYNLNDWAYMKLCEKLASVIAVTEREKTLLQWFLLIKSGYKAKIAYHDDIIGLMIPSKQKIFELPYYSFNGDDYYITNPELRSVKTYTADYPGADDIFDLTMYQPPTLPLDIKTSNIDNNRKKIKIAYNNNLRELYDDFPQSEIKLFFNSGLSPLTRESLIDHFEPLLKNKTDRARAGILLDFVQQNFDYQTDQEQFGYEKFFFADEVFMYPYADCEDRSVLFAWLIREFTSLDIIGLDYPGHISTAVAFDSNTKGHHFEHKGKTWTICDPSYIGAPVGACMPQYENSKFTIIDMARDENQPQIIENIWARIYSNGGFRNSISQGSATDAAGNIYFCGSFNNTLNLDQQKLSANNKRAGFVASFTPEGQLINGISIDKSEIVSPESIIVHDNKVFVGGKTLDGDKENLFAAGYNLQLEADWFKTVSTGESRAINWQLDAGGKELYSGKINPAEIQEKQSLQIKPDGSLKLMALSKSPVYLESKTHKHMTPYEMAKLWKNSSDAYKKQAYHKSVTGIMAFLNSLHSIGRDIKGKEIIASLNAFNPDFSTKHAGLNSNLKKIDNIEYRDDIMTIHLHDKGSIALGPIIISHGSNIKIQHYYSGNVRLEFLNGGAYKSLFRTHPLYSLKIFRSNGDMLLDYNSKHDKALLSTGNDILH